MTLMPTKRPRSWALIVPLLALLALALFAAPFAAFARRGEKPLVVGANTNYPAAANTRSLYYGAMWSRFNNPLLTEVSDPAQAGGDTLNYYLRTEIPASAFPDGWSQTWITPAKHAYENGSGVYGMLHVSECNYDNGTINPVGCVQRQVDSITTLDSHFDITIGGDTADFNVLHEFWLTSAQGDLSTKVAEVAVFLHPAAGTAAFVAAGTAIGSGTWIDKFGRSWTVRANGTYLTAICPNACSRLTGSFDWRGYMTFLKANGAIQGTWWYNGMGIGVEPDRNSGWMRLGRWRVVYN